MWIYSFFQSRFSHLSHSIIASLSAAMQLTKVLKWTFRMRLLFCFFLFFFCCLSVSCLLCIDKLNGGCVTLSSLLTCEWRDKRNEKSTIDWMGRQGKKQRFDLVPKSKQTSRNKINRVSFLRLSYYLSWNVACVWPCCNSNVIHQLLLE